MLRRVDSAVIALWFVRMEDIFCSDTFFLSSHRISSENGPARAGNQHSI
jgi:hypothetical protein